MHINDIQIARSSPQVLTENIGVFNMLVELTRSPRSRLRAHSLDQTTNLKSQSLLEHMRHTYEFKLKGFKGNTRGEHIHGPFTTLEEMLRTLPEALGIEIELSNYITRTIPVIKSNSTHRIPHALGGRRLEDGFVRCGIKQIRGHYP
jgi:hypothetical protein